MSFDRIAPVYRLMEFVLAGNKLHRCRTAWLDVVPHPESVLLLGEGHGRALVECCRRFEKTPITYIDSSRQMIHQARAALLRERLDVRNVQFIHADVFEWLENNQTTYTHIITNFFLDCFTPVQIDQLIKLISRHTRMDTHWLLADFNLPEAGWMRLRSRLILGGMYLFFKYATRLPATSLTPIDGMLQRSGFQLQQRREYEWGLLRSDWWQRTSE